VSQEVLNNVGNNPEIDWLGWCAARNSVSSSFCLDLIMFPMYTRFPGGNPLYALGVINCRARCIELYHMMGPFAAGGAFPRAFKMPLNCCSRVAQYMKKKSRADESWEVNIHYPKSEMRVAIGANNESGVCICMCALRLALGLDPIFAPEDLPGCRLRMVRDLLRLAQLGTSAQQFPSKSRIPIPASTLTNDS